MRTGSSDPLLRRYRAPTGNKTTRGQRNCRNNVTEVQLHERGHPAFYKLSGAGNATGVVLRGEKCLVKFHGCPSGRITTSESRFVFVKRVSVSPPEEHAGRGIRRSRQQ